MAMIQPWGDVAEPIHRRLAQLVDDGDAGRGEAGEARRALQERLKTEGKARSN